jgi:DNA invertase Pin-like site-specific DNA recombinase
LPDAATQCLFRAFSAFAQERLACAVGGLDRIEVWGNTAANSAGWRPRLLSLRAAGCRRIFEEAASGGRWDRPELHGMLDQLCEGDVVVVWKLDCLSRSLKDVLQIIGRIGEAGADFRSHQPVA